MLDIEQINKYYENLGIKCYWNLYSLTIEEINIITNTFNEMHIKYPDVVIEEIGDYYSTDKFIHDRNVKFVKEQLKAKQYPKHAKIVLEKFIKGDIDVNDKKYVNDEFSAKYSHFIPRILFNHKLKNDLKANTYHEFGHAVAYQYDLNDDIEINTIFNSLGKDLVTTYVTEYANTNVKEFIAEIFMLFYLGTRNEIINVVMKIIDKQIKNRKAMTETEIVTNNIFHPKVKSTYR